MPQLIKDGKPASDDWIVIDKDAEADIEQLSAQIAEGKSLILPLKLWLEIGREQASCGVWLDSDDSVEALDGHCDKLPVIAINFPGFADGRGYSLARQVRGKLGYQGDLRAIGDVLKDQLFYYQRVGFTSFQIREDRSAEQAASGLNDFSLVYQSAADERVSVNQKR